MDVADRKPVLLALFKTHIADQRSKLLEKREAEKRVKPSSDDVIDVTVTISPDTIYQQAPLVLAKYAINTPFTRGARDEATASLSSKFGWCPASSWLGGEKWCRGHPKKYVRQHLQSLRKPFE
ncbi:hypothetical protein B0H17DRAFT_1136252 [Mycena rosella]|uniref:Uncharacterized protein n=1 Tax=Mycena rosella TaxID=1033263 RepID=A0AAD7DBN9_MYCRO|nr:hypothetical protein B0H17DRAFT_1136252 [Mycena rosella]